MLITRTVTKKVLETIVHETFSNFGILSCSSLLDSLKLLGFYYATNGGISINIEDLKTPAVKKDFLKIANSEMTSVSEQWQQGFISDTERFQTIIDSWNIATESLKNRIIDYYQNFDPANNLYIMAFSGARGNMSQVRQLVGMRGLMSDQEGKIIDLPIQANFREGLSSIDYIISSYGARKGIVDTALKTADSGYLTRRLIYIAQDLVIREIDCKTKNGVIVLFDEKTTTKNIIGHILISAKSAKFPFDFIKYKNELVQNILLDENILFHLKKNSPSTLNIRSPLTCKLNGSICQKCYGWDLAHNKLISLGETVGIIAAQSIGEPGTQLTMRTFHTGGIFTSETLKQITAPFSGKIIIPRLLKTIMYRTNHGIVVSKLQQEATVIIINWKGIKKDIFLGIGSFLYLNSSSFIKKGQLISEYSMQSFLPGVRKLKPIYTSIAGEIRFENLLVRKMLRDKRTLKVNQDDGVLWLSSGKIFPLPKEIKYRFPENLSKKKSFATLKIVTPYEGVISFTKEVITICTNKLKKEINFANLTKRLTNCSVTLSMLVKNYQYVDKYTIVAMIDIFPKCEGKIYALKKKNSKYITTLFAITESDIWKINSDQVNNFSFFHEKRGILKKGNLLNANSKFSRSGFFLKKDGFKMIFQNAIPIFLSRGTILNYKQGDFVLKQELFATLVNYTQQTEDIVQGLPKIEELIEARRPKVKAYLAVRPGVILSSVIVNLRTFLCLDLNTFLNNGIIKCKLGKPLILEKSPVVKRKPVKPKRKELAQIAHSIYSKEEITIYNGKLVKVTLIPSNFEPFLKIDKKDKETDYFIFINEEGDLLLLNGKRLSSTWKESQIPFEKDYNLYKYKKEKLYKWKTILTLNRLVNKKESLANFFIVKTTENEYLLLEYYDPIFQYQLPLSLKLILKPGSFVDIAEPITEGIIDIHELLNIFFKYHSVLDGTMMGTVRSLNKFHLIFVNSVQSIYQSQGVNISSKHVEIIARQMTAKVVIKESGNTPLLPGELIRISLITEICKSLKPNKNIRAYKIPKYEPLLLSTTNSCLSKDGFLSAAGFQETKRVLTKAAIEGSTDWLRGLKECIIIGRLIPAGSAFLNYKNYLDNIYLFKN